MSVLAVDTEELLRHAGWVRALARQLVRDSHRADDLAQETMLAALRSPPRRSVDLRRWLAVVLRNTVRLTHRAEARRNARERRAAVPEELPPTSELVERLGAHQLLVDEVQRLDEPYRSVVLMRYFEGASLRSIAQHFAVPVSTINTRLRRAIVVLRSRLDRRCGSRRAWVAALLPLAERTPRPVPSLAAPGVVAWTLSLVTLGVVGAWMWSSLGEATEPIPVAPQVAEVRPEEPGRGSSLDTSVARSKVPGSSQGDPGLLDAVRGRVVDPEGTPLAGVEIGFVRYRPGDSFPAARLRRDGAVAGLREGVREPVAVARSNASGLFALSVAGPDGRVEVTDPGWATVLAGVSWQGLDRACTVVAAPVTAVHGVVFAPDGSRLSGASIALELPEGFRGRLRRALDHSVVQGWDAASDEAGRFELPRVPDLRDAVVSVKAPGCATLKRLLRFARFDLEYHLLPVAPGLLVRGRVVRGDGVPLPGAAVALGPDLSTVTDEAGEFVFPRTGFTASTITAIAEGYMPVNAVVPDEDEPLQIVVEDPLAEIAGKVVGQDGDPVAGAWVWIANPTLFAEGENRSLVAESIAAGVESSWNVAVSDLRGSFRIPSLSRDDYVLRASVAGSARFAELGPVAAGSNDVVLRYPNDGTQPRLAGRVVDRRGAPVQGALVTATRDALRIPLPSGRHTSWKANGPATRTGADGRFELRDVPDAAGLYVGGNDLIDRTLPPGSWDDPDAIEVRISFACHLQVEVLEPAEADLTFAILDAAGGELEIRVPLGIATQPLRRCPIVDGRSPVVLVPDDAEWVALYADDRELGRRRAQIGRHGVARISW